MGIEKALTNAFSVAVQNLLADSGFHQLVVSRRSAETVSPATNEVPIRIHPTASSPSVLLARDATVTIFAGPGHGSGFLISNDGYVVTNEHVLREARFVKVRLANGREVLGDVVRTDASHDAAVIKLREVNLPAAALGLGFQPPVGSDVFAIGTPRRESLDTTVTRGIVSAYRDERGQKLIQSDVQIQPGNSGGPLVGADGRVVGMAVSGYMVGAATQNLNFFLPIDDVVKALNLDLR